MFAIIVVPVFLIAEQPIMGTALLVMAAASSCSSWRPVAGLPAWAASRCWAPRCPGRRYLLHDYQRQRVLTLLDPQSDALGAGYHIIQSQIAIGSAAFSARADQRQPAQLEFLPERSTDFIYAVHREELGLLGLLALLFGYLFIIARGLYMATAAAMPSRASSRAASR